MMHHHECTRYLGEGVLSVMCHLLQLVGTLPCPRVILQPGVCSRRDLWRHGDSARNKRTVHQDHDDAPLKHAASTVVLLDGDEREKEGRRRRKKSWRMLKLAAEKSPWAPHGGSTILGDEALRGHDVNALMESGGRGSARVKAV